MMLGVSKRTPAKMAPGLESADIARLAEGSHGDTFSVLGRHAWNGKEIFRCFLPRSRSAWINEKTNGENGHQKWVRKWST